MSASQPIEEKRGGSSPPGDGSRWLLTVVAIAVVLGTVALLIRSSRTTNVAALQQLRAEAADLRAQLEVRDSTISSLQADVLQLRRLGLGSGKPQTAAALPADLELARLVADLSLQQSNIAVVIERLMVRTAETTSPGRGGHSAQEAAVAALEISVQEEYQKFEAAKARTAELLISMNIPVDVSTMDAAKALDTATLRAYWPFFEAKRERDSLQLFAERLRLRLAQERMDARMENAR